MPPTELLPFPGVVPESVTSLGPIRALGLLWLRKPRTRTNDEEDPSAETDAEAALGVETIGDGSEMEEVGLVIGGLLSEDQW